MSNAPPLNPYAPPAAELNPVPVPKPVSPLGPLASRGARLGGSIVDGLVFLAAALPLYFDAGLQAVGAERQAHPWNPFIVYTAHGRWGHVTGVLILAQLAVQWTLLYRRGQTVGKIVAGTRVVRLDGSRASFARIIVLRTWVPFVIGLMGKVGPWVGLADILFIFRASRRCLHDEIAGTKVVPVTAPPQPPP
jgi:uncharacterized RDD family membrane protein YckC